MNSYIVEMLISSFYGKVVSGRQQMLNNAKSHECDPGSFFMSVDGSSYGS